MPDELVIKAWFELLKVIGKGVVAGVSYLMSRNNTTAAETQGPLEMYANETAVLVKYNTLSGIDRVSGSDRDAIRQQLLKSLDDQRKNSKMSG